MMKKEVINVMHIERCFYKKIKTVLDVMMEINKMYRIKKED